MTSPPKKKKKKKLKPAALIERALRRTDDQGRRLYSDEVALNTMTACVLGIMVESNILKWGEELQEIAARALLHAELHGDMTQEEFNEGLARFLATNPPQPELLDELSRVFKKIVARAEKRKRQRLEQRG